MADGGSQLVMAMNYGCSWAKTTQNFRIPEKIHHRKDFYQNSP